MRYLVQTFGCQMNVHDSRRIEEVLDAHGGEPTDEASLADVIVFNTCSVREKAEHKLLSVLGSARALKNEKHVVLVVAGCVAQQEGEKLLRRAPHLDVVIGPDNIPELPGLIVHIQDGNPPIARTVFDLDDPQFLHATPRKGERQRSEISSFVTVMKGCDERCTFCIVPYTRGSERYRPADDILAEAKQMVAGGVREITLLGQTVNSWFDPTSTEDIKISQFASLLRRIAEEVPDLKRLRYTSPHPRHITDELIAAHRDLDVLAAHVHMPVQSGSNRLLKRMLRRYTREHYLERITALKASRVGLTLSTDIIVGFPGETEEDFQETLSLVREAAFTSAFAFKYSQRPYTPALKLDDDVSEEEKDRRLSELLALVETQQRAHHATLVGTTQNVLFESESKIKGEIQEGLSRWRGRTNQNEIVHIDAPLQMDLTGVSIDVVVKTAYPHSLAAEASSYEGTRTRSLEEAAWAHERRAVPKPSVPVSKPPLVKDENSLVGRSDKSRLRVIAQ